jgi:DNA-directed RNA polymerase subunit RPC12/RpoP
MIDTVLNLMFRCSHKRLTRPITPVMKTGQPDRATYVVCLECGKQFAYDVKEMQIGKPIDRSPDVGVLPPNMPKPRKTKLTYALLAVVPAAVVLRAVLKRQKPSAAPPPAPEEAARSLREVDQPSA